MSVVVITCAAGHLGAVLVPALLTRDRQVRALAHHDRRMPEGLDLENGASDVKDPDSLHRAFAGAEVIYHAAA